jgi:hypothetical protein
MFLKSMTSVHNKRSLLLILLLNCAFQTACDQQKPQTYKIPKELNKANVTVIASDKDNQNQSPSAMQVLPGMVDFANQASEITYTVPATWTEYAPSSIRKANFKIKDADGTAEVSVTVFPGTVGGYLANINRWRQQITLDPINESKLNEILIPYTISNHQGYYTLLEGNTQSILGALLQFHGVTWFVKMQGSLLTVQNEKESFLNFLSSVEIVDTHH